MPAAQEVKLLKTSPSALQATTLVPLQADWVASHTSGTQTLIMQYQDAGQSSLARHCLHAPTEVSQTMPRALQSAFVVQMVLQTLRRQRLLLEPQLLSPTQSMQRLFAVSQTLVEQSAFNVQIAAAAHRLPMQSYPVAQSEFAMH
jgi:hypothetical protein